MAGDRSTRVEEIFDQAVDLSGDERSEFLQRECGADQGLRQAVESLLDAYDRSPTYFDRPIAAPVLGMMQQGRSRSWIGRQVGPFTIEEPIGDGGMGSVFLAEQQAPVRRRVALKVMNATFASEQMVRRFSAERQALALMNHPYIAQVYESGSTDDGEPWVAMEYVEGVALNDYCDDRRLSLRQRLELFLKVCGGVQHAHRKGIIHRDLKPSNVLVSGEGESAMPKIIDFGIAKAIDQRLVDATLATGHWLMGTPSYMSPERFGPEGDVDTRADVYSLGVMLYELLVGELPFEREADDVLEIAAKIQTDEAERPSSRVTTAPHDELTAVAERRSTDAAGLTRALRGDLDWICLKAMEADRERRYESASELAADIRRHLANEPVAARPPSAAYRIGKYVRRHTVAVVAAAAVVVAVIAGVVGIALQSQRANEQAARAIEAGARASEQQLRAEQVSQFLVELFEVSDPSEAKGNTVTAREILDRGAEKISTELEDEPEVQATLMLTIGKVYESLGLFEPAASMIESALETQRAALGEDHEDVAVTRNRLGSLRTEQGRFREAEQLIHEAIKILRLRYGSEHPEIAIALHNLAGVHVDHGRYSDAERLIRDALAMERKLLGDGDEEIANSLNTLAIVLQRQGKYDESEIHQREALAAFRALYGDQHMSVAMSLNNLAMLMDRQGRYAEAEQLHRETLDHLRSLLQGDHLYVAATLNNLAIALQQQSRYGEAELFLRESLTMARRSLGESHPLIANCLSNLATGLDRQGRHADAEPLHREALEHMVAIFGEEHPHVAYGMYRLASCLGDQNKLAESQRLHGEALDMRRRVLGPEHPDVAGSLLSLGRLQRDRGEFEQAETQMRQAIDIYRKGLPAKHPSLGDALVDLGRLLSHRGDPAPAEDLLREAVDIELSNASASAWRIARAEGALGDCLVGLGRYAEAEPLLESSHARLVVEYGEDSSDARQAVERLVVLHEAWGHDAKADRYRDLLKADNAR